MHNINKKDKLIETKTKSEIKKDKKTNTKSKRERERKREKQSEKKDKERQKQSHGNSKTTIIKQTEKIVPFPFDARHKANAKKKSHKR